MRVAVVIPARLGSSRLPEKVLKSVAGKSLLERVWLEAGKIQTADQVVVACDDAKVLTLAESFGAEAMMTGSHPNGTARLGEVAAKTEADVFINVQGDQPILDGRAIDDMITLFEKYLDVQVATLVKRSTDAEDFQNPNVVKAVLDGMGRAIYFSRAPIPYDRDRNSEFYFHHHIGVYGYRKEFLLDFLKWESGRLEDLEKLEQLRILEKGFPIHTIETKGKFFSIDTEDDLKEAERILNHEKDQTNA